jgi:2-dehydro-3-deoxyphosphogluconate aldolase/(4S)-4-hydroxy-2-oxoglutarate aldolase
VPGEPLSNPSGLSMSADALEEILACGPVIPVVIIDRPQDAVALAGALHEGGMRVVEVTLRTPCALEAIERISKAFPEMRVGAGTLRSQEDVRAAKQAGAAFGVSPGYLARIDEACEEVKLPLLPGVATPTEIMQATARGRRLLKLFPAQAVGGVALLKALASPFSGIRFCPTGGISLTNARDYLALPNVACVGGSWMAPADLIAQGRWASISELAAQAQQLSRP